MEAHSGMSSQAVTAARVRSNTGSALLGGGSLLFVLYYFGFTPPAATNLFTLGDAIFNYALRVGGYGLLVVAGLSFSGKPIVLLLDGLISTTAGAALAASGLFMMLGAGEFALNQALYVVFGGLFVSVGLRNGCAFFECRSQGGERSGAARFTATSPAPGGGGSVTVVVASSSVTGNVPAAHPSADAGVSESAPPESRESSESALASFGRQPPPRVG
jgi:hypothetical protein